MNRPARLGHPEVRWFTHAAMGICFDWGIENTQETDPKANPASAEQRLALARQFDPNFYDPAGWLRLAAQAGFRYALFTARDSHGYTLWPGSHGDLGVHSCLDGRDLVQLFIDAGRKLGIKTGLRFVIPNDSASEHDDDSTIQNQLEELLTRYGKIDLLYLEGPTSAFSLDSLRRFQPGMVIGSSSGAGAGAGEANDFQVVASGQAIEKPEGWWVRPAYLNPHDPAKSSLDTALGDLLKTLVETRAGGGNLMARCRPPSTGQLPESYASLMTGLRQWLSHSGESIFGTRSGPWPDQSDVPVTTRGDTWYLHFLSREIASSQVDAVGRPAKTRLLRTGDPVPFTYYDGTLTVTPTAASRSDLVDVVGATGVTLSQRQ